jgi:hypothetical protein
MCIGFLRGEDQDDRPFAALRETVEGRFHYPYYVLKVHYRVPALIGQRFARPVGSEHLTVSATMTDNVH